MISKASKIRAESMADRRACRSRLTDLALSEAKNNRATRNVLFKTKAILQASRRSADSWWNETPHIVGSRTGRPFVSPEKRPVGAGSTPSRLNFTCTFRATGARKPPVRAWQIKDRPKAVADSEGSGIEATLSRGQMMRDNRSLKDQTDDRLSP